MRFAFSKLEDNFNFSLSGDPPRRQAAAAIDFFVAFAVAGSDNIRYNRHDRETHRQTAALVGLVQAGSTTVLAVIRMAA